MTCGLVHTSYSLPEWQAVKVTVFAPCSMYPPYEPLRPECQCLMTERSWLWYQWNYFLYTKMYTTQIFVLKIGHTESNIMISPLLSRATHMWLLMIPQNGKLARRPISHQNRNLWILICHWILNGMKLLNVTAVLQVLALCSCTRLCTLPWSDWAFWTHG